MAFSSIVHVGFLFSPILLNDILLLCNYSIVYSLLSLNVIAILLHFSVRKNNEFSLSLRHLFFLTKTNSLLSIILCLAFLSLAGIPPLAGFFAKFYLFMGFVLDGWYKYTLLGFLLSSISTIYYLRVTHFLNFTNSKRWLTYNNSLTQTSSYLLSLYFLFNICFLFLFGSFIEILFFFLI